MSDAATPAPAMNLEWVGRLKAKFKANARKLTELEARQKTLEAERDAAKTEAATAKAKWDENKLVEENTALKQQIRTATHRAAFARVAKAAGADDEAIEPLWKLGGYAPDKDDVDEAALTKLIEAQKVAPGTARLFGEPTPPSTPGPARGQGSPAKNGNGKFQASRAQLRDPAWCREHGAERDEAIAKNNFELLD